jgi:hypothetical protein
MSIQKTIETVRRMEETTYGEGTALLLHRIADALEHEKRVLGGKKFHPRTARMLIAKALREYALVVGHDPSIEVASRAADEEGFVGEGSEYVGYEAGPYQWAIPASGIVYEITGLLAEPHYSFDLCISKG